MNLTNRSQTNKLLATTELNCRRTQKCFDQSNNAKYDDEARRINKTIARQDNQIYIKSRQRMCAITL